MGDVKAAEARDYANAHARILAACEVAFKSEANQANCSGFVKAVGTTLGIPVGTTGSGQANDIYDEIGKPPWMPLGESEEGARRAIYAARQGFFVIAAWKSEAGKNGHVAVVTDLANLDRKTTQVTTRNILASWGVLDHSDLARLGGSIRESFSVTKKLPKVRYAAQYIRKFR
jgi:hypothetical protein